MKYFVIGFFIGMAVGIFLTAICKAASNDFDYTEDNNEDSL